MKRISIFLMLMVSLCSIGVIDTLLPIKDLAMQKNDELVSPPITIWIHGTLFLFRYIIPHFLHIKQGLVSLSCDDYKEHYYTLIARNLEQQDPQRFSLQNFYLFGWSGKLSFEERLEAAKKLNKDLKNLIIDYQKKYDRKPFIRIITHSHGGNVALNLANLADCDEDSDLYTETYVDELILLACPVQQETEPFVHKPCFKKIISLFSKIDLIQILDPQGIYNQDFKNFFQKKPLKKPFFSQRKFQSNEKIVQAQIKINRKNLFHIDFMLDKFLKCLPEVLDIIEAQKTEMPLTYFEKPLKLKLK